MSDRARSVPGWVLPAGLAAVVIVLVVVALARGPVELDSGTPEGAVQEYLLAVSEKRWDDAVADIHPQWLGECDADDLALFGDFAFSAELGTSGDRFGQFATGFDVPDENLPEPDAHVEVTISRGDDGALGSGWDEYVTFDLVAEDDSWWISGDPWPYFVWNCRI